MLDYLMLPFVTWFFTGITKFLVNSVKERKMAFSLIGYGGMPSNHSAIVSSMTTFVALNEGIQSSAFGVALAFSFIVLLDASSLRRQIGKQSVAINVLLKHSNISDVGFLRERIGHTPLEIFLGLLFGSVIGSIFYFIF